MFKKLLTYICMLFVAGVGFFGVSHNQTNSSFHLITSNEVFAWMCDDDPAQCWSQNTQANAWEQDKAMREMYNKLVGWLNIFLAIVTIIVSPAIMFAGWLMSPDWTSGDLFGIRPVLHNLWILVANVTYFIYAILLILRLPRYLTPISTAISNSSRSSHSVSSWYRSHGGSSSLSFHYRV